jgi:hypothetical protein
LVSIGFLGLASVLAGIPTVLAFNHAAEPDAERVLFLDSGLWMALSLAALILVEAAAAGVPLVLGMKALRKMEF